jgi:formylglycine-generating enzyme required for sulfatase activity
MIFLSAQRLALFSIIILSVQTSILAQNNLSGTVKLSFDYSYAFVSQEGSVLVKLKKDTVIDGIPCFSSPYSFDKNLSNLFWDRTVLSTFGEKAKPYFNSMAYAEQVWHSIISIEELLVECKKEGLLDLVADYKNEKIEYMKIMPVDVECDKNGNLIRCFLAKEYISQNVKYEKYDLLLISKNSQKSVSPTPAPVPMPPIQMVVVPGGTFHNGTTDVTVSSFKMSATEVTQAQYQAVIGENPSNFRNVPWRKEGDPRKYPEDLSRPVEDVSWYETIVFCNKLSMMEKLTPVYTIAGSKDPDDWGWTTIGTPKNSRVWDAASMDISANGYRLPTEAEWEYAARGGTPADNFRYSGSDDIDAVGWYESNSGNITHSVGLKRKNRLGLFDMTGNVSEWCWDWDGIYANGPQVNPTGPVSGELRVVRGGSYIDPADKCSVSERLSFRVGSFPSHNYVNLGFRLVLQIPMSQPVSDLQLLPIKMVTVQGGTFRKGTADLKIPTFKMSKTEVTQAQYQAVMGSNPALFKGDLSRPVECVSWYDALVFCNKLSIQEGLSPIYAISGSTNPSAWGNVPTIKNDVWDAVVMNKDSNGYRLPTTEEWEYAARGGTPLDNFTFSGSNTVGEVAWCSENSDKKTHPVGSKNPNKLGLYDMSGNVSEWCWDWLGSSGIYRLKRGGDFLNDLELTSISIYGGWAPFARSGIQGFRVVTRQP